MSNMHLHASFIVFFVLARTTFASPAAAQPAWTPVADLPEARTLAFAAAIAPHIYVLTSGEDGTPGADLFRFDLASGWTRLPGAPSHRRAFGGAALDGRLYIWGGLTRTASGAEAVDDSVEVFDAASGKWSAAQGRLPRARLFAKGAAVNGRLYAVGGIVPPGALAAAAGDNERLSTAVHEYDPRADRWRERAAMPARRRLFQVQSAGGRLYAIGGWSPETSNEQIVEEYDPAANAWTRKADMPAPAYDAAAVAVGQEIYVIGAANSPDVRAYNPPADRWSLRPALPNGLRGRVAAVLDGRVYAIGGAARGVTAGLSRAVHVLEPGSAEAAAVRTVERPSGWVRRRDMPTPRREHAALACGGKIYLVGGTVLREGKLEATRAVDIYDPTADSWSSGPEMPALDFRVAAAVGDAIYVFGASGSYKYLPAAAAWTPIAPLPSVRSAPAIAVVNGRILVVGGMVADAGHRDGWVNSSFVDEYDPAANTWRARAPILTPGHAFTAATLGGRVYLMGGDSEPNLRGVEWYDPAADRWTRAAAMPIPNGYNAAFASKGRIVALPGAPSSAWAPQEYDPAANAWCVTWWPAHQQRRHYAAAVVDGTIYTFGGTAAAPGQPDRLLATVEALGGYNLVP